MRLLLKPRALSMATNLANFYSKKGQPLPPLSERAKLFDQYKLGPASSYTGTAAQNAALLDKLSHPASPTSSAVNGTKNKPAAGTFEKLLAALAALLAKFSPTAPAATKQECPQKSAATSPTTTFDGSANPNLGALSERYESGGRGPGEVSTGEDDPGGVSYGTYQLATNENQPKQFLESEEGKPWASRFEGQVQGSAEFTKTWKATAAEEPKAFGDAQHTYIKRTHYNVQVAQVQLATGIDLSVRSHALQDVVWSTAVQHGGETNVVEVALKNVDVDPSSPNFDEKLIKAIYAERGRTDLDGTLVRFTKSPPRTQKNVAARFVDEERRALEMLGSGNQR